jgi:SAM-dependent methyltransferase
MNTASFKRVENEIEHGRMLAESEAESIWGWGTPAGRVRAKRRADLIATGAGLGPNVRALEIGCGTGMFTEMFAQSGAQLVAVDLSGDLLKKARERGLPSDRVQFVEKPFEACDVEGPFDAIIGSSLLHHLDLDAALPRIYSLLKPGGVMSFAEPNMLNPQIMLQKNIPWIKKRMGDSPDETAFVRWAFRARLAKVGFNDVEIVPFDWLHPATPKAMITVVSSIGSLMERVVGLREFAGSLYIRCCRPQNQPAADGGNHSRTNSSLT